MRLYNSLTRQTEEFRPLEPGHATMYVCGLTPYDSAHIGHTRTYVAFDSIKRYLISKGYAVRHIQNITDVDDKILRRCKELAMDPKTLVDGHHREALAYFDRLHILRADIYPAVTQHIPQILELIRELIAKGYAYETKTGIYYRVAKFAAYGRLSGQKPEEIRAGARVEVDETKEAPEDFALWKKTAGELLEFDSPWGPGRPGWHIECSAMAHAYAQRTLDIHGGARDLIFPHHENEIAQSEPAFGKFCNHWLHTGFLTVDGEKMSKSLGNFITIKQALEQFSPNAIRLFFLQTHYRSPIDYNEDALRACEESAERIFNSLGLLREEKEAKKHTSNPTFRNEVQTAIAQFYAHLDNDFDTPNALAALFGLLRTVNVHLQQPAVDRSTLAELEESIPKMLWIFGLEENKPSMPAHIDGLKELLSDVVILRQGLGAYTGLYPVDLGKYANKKDDENTNDLIEDILKIREDLRARKKYPEADSIRVRLLALNIELEDKKQGGVRWKITTSLKARRETPRV